MSKPCYICGSASGLTKDHVFPKCLFVPPLPQDMLTAPACRACQQRIQPDEELFRNFVAAGSYSDATARALWETKVAGSFVNSPGMRTTFVNSVRTMEWKSPGGVILGDLTVVEGDKDRTENVLRKIVRGLHFLDSGGQVMPFDVRYRIEQVTPMNAPMPESVMDIYHGMELRTVGDAVRYKFQIIADEPRATASWMEFYGKMMFVVFTWPDDVELPERPPVPGKTEAAPT
jgi:hypothetical protein